MGGSWGRGLVVGVAGVLVALALLGRGDPTVVGEIHRVGDASAISAVVDVDTPATVRADAAGRGLVRAVRPVSLPVGDDESALAGAVATALLLGGWVLARGDGWGVRPVVVARRGPPR